jgi:hypothetical protein
MYNTNINIQYFNIEQELIKKYYKEKKDYKSELENKNEEYTIKDIEDICTKLYMDEYTSVFNAKNIYDDSIDIEMKTLYEIMILNNDFKAIIDDCFNILSNHPVIEININQYYMIFVLFFQKDLFYKIHKCICSQLLNNNIDSDLLQDFRIYALQSIKNI